MSPAAIDSLQALKDYVGKEIGVSDWFRVSQERIRQFAEATGDKQWIHLDPERARKESPYGATIAHGFLTLSLLSHLTKEVLRITAPIRMAVNYGLNRVRFPAAVRANANIRARITLLSLKEAGPAVEATFGVTVECEGGDKPACVAEWVVRYYT